MFLNPTNQEKVRNQKPSETNTKAEQLLIDHCLGELNNLHGKPSMFNLEKFQCKFHEVSSVPLWSKIYKSDRGFG